MAGRSNWLTGGAVALALTLVATDFANADSWRRAQRRASRGGYVGVQYAGHQHGYQGGYGQAGGYSQACPCECETPAHAQPINGEPVTRQPVNQQGQPFSAARPIYDDGVQPQRQPNLIEGAIDPGQQPRNGQYFPAQQNPNLNIQGNLNANGRVESDLPGGDVNAARQNQPPMNPQSRELNNQIQNSVDDLNR